MAETQPLAQRQRRRRFDAPGAWHHVTCRGIARRTCFERPPDYRYFLACIARAVRRGEIEVHAYAILENHFHLLLRSPDGMLSVAMQRILAAYVRYFNRTRRRDGPLFNGRFKSRPARTRGRRVHFVRYIDDNPIDAALAEEASGYMWCSAYWYARSGPRPRWLARDWIESEVSRLPAGGDYVPSLYQTRFPSRLTPEQRAWLRLLAEEGREPAALADRPVAPSANVVRRWLESRALLSDGAASQGPVCASLAVLSTAREAGWEMRPWKIRRGRSVHDGWMVALTGLLRDACALEFRTIASILGCPTTTAHNRARAHRALTIEEAAYAERVSEILAEAVRRSR